MMVGRYRKEKITVFKGCFVHVDKYGIFSVTFGLAIIGFKLIVNSPYHVGGELKEGFLELCSTVVSDTFKMKILQS